VELYTNGSGLYPMLGLGIIRVEPSCCANAVLAVVAYLLKPSIVEPEKQSLLANGSETTFVSRQRLSKKKIRGNRYAYNNRGIVVFSTHPVPRGDKKDNWGNQVSSVRESEEKSHLEGSRHSERT
jgi:hypothetical protein